MFQRHFNLFNHKVPFHFDVFFSKPENVMLVDPNSTDIKIIDFGLAKRYSPNEEIKVLSGTPAFAGKKTKMLYRSLFNSQGLN